MTIKAFGIAAMTLAVILPVAAYASPPPSYTTLLSQALEAVRTGQDAQAIRLYEEVLASHPSATIRTPVETALRQLHAVPSTPSSAENHASTTTLPPELVRLQAAIKAEPLNLDHSFAYAQAAQTLGHPVEAEQAYLYMLEIQPNLDRVKLDLALLYFTTHQAEKAKPLLEEVKSHNPPPEVLQKIEALLNNKVYNPHEFSGNATVGYSHDTNANSASSSDAVSVLDTTLSLPDDARQQDDGQIMAMASLNHTYYMPETLALPHSSAKWMTSSMAYKTEQINLDELDLSILSLRTGPAWTVEELRTTLGLAGGATYVRLGGEHYLNVFSAEINAEYTYTPRLAFTGALSAEDRAFFNSPTVATHESRTGNAYQATAGVNYTLTENDLLSGQLTARQENAQVDYYASQSYGISTAYTHAFPLEIFSQVTAGYRNAEYDGADSFISSAIREDKEATAGVTLGKALPYNTTATLGYQYRNVDSTIQNYDYDNHRISTNLGIRF